MECCVDVDFVNVDCFLEADYFVMWIRFLI